MKQKILIIEDNQDLQEIYKSSFEDRWFIVAISNNWLQGIVDAVSEKPDIILLDIMMPEMNWFEVLQTITQQSSIKLPIIVCSNLSQEIDIDKAYGLWADKYIKKSEYTWDEIVDQVIDFLKK